MKIKPVRNDRLSDKVVEQLLDMMRSGELKPGDKLPNEAALAEEFAVSRGVVREALTQLQAQEYITRRPKDGTVIRDDIQSQLMDDSVRNVLKKATYSDLIVFREALEMKTTELVIDRASDDDIAELFEGLQDVATNDEIQRSMDQYFHYKLAQISGNTFFMNFIDTYYDLISEIASAGHHNQKRREQICAEHQAIADAVAKRDKEAARAAVQHHMRMVNTTIRNRTTDD